MTSTRNHKWVFLIPILIGIILILAFEPISNQIVIAKSGIPAWTASTQLIKHKVENSASIVYLPVAIGNHPWQSPFGVESNKRWDPQTEIFQRGVDLGIKWARVGNRISWRDLQPNEGEPIHWEALSDFESELKALKAAGITPVVIIQDSPYWATVSPTSCAAIRSDKFEAFATFVSSLVLRYKAPEFDVHNWELGNEPDVDPSLVPQDSVFGCWGDIEDEYYGGEHYGEMIKVVGPAIKEADPAVKVWLGGLLLATPDTTDPKLGKPELFFKGVLKAGATPYIDIVAYHWYPPYLNQNVDYDLIGQWKDWGGGTIGKAKYLRQLMAQYGVSKPVFLNETSLTCPPTVADMPTGYCSPPTQNFFQMQANYGVRSFVRGLSETVMGYSWYTLNGPGWKNTGLLQSNNDPRPSYIAYQQLIKQLTRARYISKVNYGNGIEAYAFKRGNEILHIAWAIDDVTLTLLIPKNEFKAAYDRDGKQISPPLEGNSYKVSVGFNPVYILRQP